MKRTLSKTGKLLMTLGLVIILIPYTGQYFRHEHGEFLGVSDDRPGAFLVSTNRPLLHVNITLDRGDQPFSMYVLTWQDANETFVQDRSINEADPIASFENLTHFYDTIAVPEPGLYCFVFTTSSEEVMYLDAGIREIGMSVGLLTVGSGVFAAGALCFILALIYRRR